MGSGFGHDMAQSPHQNSPFAIYILEYTAIREEAPTSSIALYWPWEIMSKRLSSEKDTGDDAEVVHDRKSSEEKYREPDTAFDDRTHNGVGQTATFRTEHSDNPLFIADLSYTKEEESKVIRILDTRLFPWILLTTFVLNMDRTNHSNAVSDNLPADLGFTINTVNLGVAIYSVIFSCSCFSGAVMAKIVGPSRCMCLHYP